MVVSANRYLNESEQRENAKYIWDRLRAFGWSEQATAALLGNTQIESGHNPGIWEGLNPNNPNRGFGLVQYTPGSMLQDYARSISKSPGNMDLQLELIDSDHFGHWIMTEEYNFSFAVFKTSTQSEVALADAFMKNFERPANQYQPDRGTHATRWLKEFTGTSGGANTPVIVENGGNISKAIDWMQERRGKVTYSMSNRNGPSSYDCSSAVFTALKYAGFPIPYVGNTETLYSMEGDLLRPISRSEVRMGDIFVSGVKGGSNNAYGHTGFALSETQAIHCSSVFNGIGISSNADSSIRAYSGAPVYWYRVAGSNIASPTADVDEEDNTIYITDVNDGKDYLLQDQLVSLFGIKIETVTFADVESPNDLKQKAMDSLNNQPMELNSMRLNYAQLHQIYPQYSKLKKGEVVTVVNDDLDIRTRMRIERKSFSLDDDMKGTLSMGKQRKTLTNWMRNPRNLTNMNMMGRNR